MAKVTIDDIEIEVDNGLTVIQACELAGKEIPRFCYHERLAVAGNCRMCLVEMEKSPKPIASCAMPVADGMKIKTDSEMVRKARHGVMEFLLINHPLDCPICDQGGECDLQDQAMAYGFDRSRFHEMKRAVEDKYFGPLVKTTMNRCIQCTRCIRFVSEVAGVPELGATGRGEDMEITTYIEKALSSELSGNIIDLCPVGALTSKPYSFVARPWELKKTEGIDVTDALGSNIKIETRGAEIMRIVPRNNDDVNEEWLSDKGRFSMDGLKRQRLDRPYVRKNGKLAPVSWNDAFEAVEAKLKGVPSSKIAAIAGDLVDCESMFALKGLMTALGSANIDCRQDGAHVGGGPRSGYLFNSTIAGIEQADAILLIGTNPRTEAPVLNARIRKRFLRGGLAVALVGPQVDLTYRYTHLGIRPADMDKYADALKSAKKPMIVVGSGALARPDGAAILAAARALAESCGAIKDGWNGFNVLHRVASRVGGLDLGFVPGAGGKGTHAILEGAGKGEISVVYLLGADELDMNKLGSAFVIYQGHHGDAGAARADVVLPGAAYTEKPGTYVNMEGRVQRAERAAFPVGDARDDWAILRALSERLGKTLPYDTIDALRAEMAKAYPTFAKRDTVEPAAWGDFGTKGQISNDPFLYPIVNFYMTDAIGRASVTMAKCVSEIANRDYEIKTGTYG